MEVELLAITPNAEEVIERAGRTCYMSQGRISEKSASKFIRMLISKGHLSILEHAYATFRISGISRASTHQIVRHRLCSFSQKSQRYVTERDGDFVVPPSVRENERARTCFEESVTEAKGVYERLLELGIPREDARFVLPNAASSEIVLSANFRELRHVIVMRGSKEAQWEVREMVKRILMILKDKAPNVFFDLSVDANQYVEPCSSHSPE
jgi:thymidylate synthase (FAD)